MGFGHTLMEWMRALHRGATATLMLHTLTQDIKIIFSFRLGDPLAMVLFTIQIEPLLVLLERCLRGLWIGRVGEASLGYVDDVQILMEDEKDLLVLDTSAKDFEAASGAILDKNLKSLRSWD